MPKKFGTAKKSLNDMYGLPTWISEEEIDTPSPDNDFSQYKNMQLQLNGEYSSESLRLDHSSTTSGQRDSVSSIYSLENDNERALSRHESQQRSGSGSRHSRASEISHHSRMSQQQIGDGPRLLQTSRDSQRSKLSLDSSVPQQTAICSRLSQSSAPNMNKVNSTPEVRVSEHVDQASCRVSQGEVFFNNADVCSEKESSSNDSPPSLISNGDILRNTGDCPLCGCPNNCNAMRRENLANNYSWEQTVGQPPFPPMFVNATKLNGSNLGYQWWCFGLATPTNGAAPHAPQIWYYGPPPRGDSFDKGQGTEGKTLSRRK